MMRAALALAAAALLACANHSALALSGESQEELARTDGAQLSPFVIVWMGCMRSQAAILSKSKATVTEVVSATFAACIDDEKLFLLQAERRGLGNMKDRMRAHAAEQLTLVIIRARQAAGK